jgi:precorrin-2 dehydrogenase/sirohydrochlorin ferrochelatase
MRTHAVFLRLEGRRCVVVGGDDAAATKVDAAVRAGAHVTVVAERPSPALERLAADASVVVERRPYREGDLRGAFVAYASERNPRTIALLRAEAEREHVLLNVIDVPDACTFLSPSVLVRGDLQVAVGTGGTSPGAAARIRREIERTIGPEYGPYVAILGAVRRALDGTPGRVAVMERLVDSELLSLVRRGEPEAVDDLLVRLAGERCSLARLGVALGEV